MGAQRSARAPAGRSGRPDPAGIADHLGGRLAPGQLVGVVLVRTDEDDRPVRPGPHGRGRSRPRIQLVDRRRAPDPQKTTRSSGPCRRPPGDPRPGLLAQPRWSAGRWRCSRCGCWRTTGSTGPGSRPRRGPAPGRRPCGRRRSAGAGPYGPGSTSPSPMIPARIRSTRSRAPRAGTAPRSWSCPPPLPRPAWRLAAGWIVAEPGPARRARSYLRWAATRLRFGRQQAEPGRGLGDLLAGPDVQPAQECGDVVVDRPRRDDQPGRDLGVGGGPRPAAPAPRAGGRSVGPGWPGSPPAARAAPGPRPGAAGGGRPRPRPSHRAGRGPPGRPARSPGPAPR